MTTQALAAQMIDYQRVVKKNADQKYFLKLAIDGMNCAGCGFKIEKALRAQANVDAHVNVTEKRLDLAWQGEEARGQDLIALVTNLGFRVALVKEKDRIADENVKKLLWYMAISGFASGNLMIFSLALWFTTRETMGASTRDLMHWYSALIALPTTVYAGQPFFKSAWNALKAKRTNMDVPISVAIILTSAVSFFETVRGGEHVYFDSAIMLIFLLLIGRYIDAKARAYTKSAASDLLSLMQGSATVIEGEMMRRVAVEDLKKDMMVMVARGEKILVDGYVTSSASLDASLLTGETIPQNLPENGIVHAGMINVGQAFKMVVLKTQEQSLVTDIIHLMQKAEQGGARYVQIADQIARWYTPVIHMLAALTFIVWVGLGLPWQQALLYAITVLVITCPCALALAVPVAHVVTGSRLFKNGILLKSFNVLERLAEIDTIIFDKTGTLTKGKINFENRNDFLEAERMMINTLARASRHPLAIAAYDPSLGAFDIKVIENEGQGMEASYQGSLYRLGSRAFTGAKADIDDDKLEIWFGGIGQMPKRLIFSDIIHDDAEETIALLQKKYSIILLSGDRHTITESVAKQLKIDNFYAQVNPKDKFDILEHESQKGHKVLMIGDGLNDAAALMRAHASMSPSSAIDITQNASDLVYRREGIAPVSEALTAAKETQQIVKQNFLLSLAYNMMAVPMAMAGEVTPLIAAVLMSLSSLAVILNALRLKERA